jgi:hypothetical protein
VVQLLGAGHYDSGDDGDEILQLGEVWIYKANGTATAGQYVNLGTVKGHYGDIEVSDEDPSHYFGSTIPTTPPVEVGGEIYPISKVWLLTPAIALAIAFLSVTGIIIRRRITQR